MKWIVKNRSTLEAAKFAVSPDSVDFISGSPHVAHAVRSVLEKGITEKCAGEAQPGSHAIGLHCIPALGHASLLPLERHLESLGFLVTPTDEQTHDGERISMPKHLDPLTVKKILWDRVYMAIGIKPNANGYLPEGKQYANLLSGIPLDLIHEDYSRGGGHEWDRKFRAIHSSAALAANTFGFWRKDPNTLALLNHKDFTSVRLEWPFRTGLGGTPPTLDAVLECKNTVIGVESKFLEILQPKQPHFSASYDNPDLPFEPQWHELYKEAATWGPLHLDVAQIVKHYLGLRRNIADGRKIVLLYAYWEPTNAAEFTQYVDHRQQVDQVARLVSGSQVDFVAMSHFDLWKEWLDVPALRPHAVELYERYSFAITT